MLSEKEIKLVVTSAMARYSAENPGKRGMTKKDVIDVVAGFGGDSDDVRAAMLVGLERLKPDHGVHIRY